MFVHPSIHHSVCPWGGGYPSQFQVGEVPLPGVPHLGYPPQIWLGVPLPGGTPPLVPPVRPGWGVPLPGGTPPQISPCQTWPWGLPLLGGGYPTLDTPHQTWPGGTPPQVTDGVLHMPQSVCLLRSCRRTFLFKYFFIIQVRHGLFEMIPRQGFPSN